MSDKDPTCLSCLATCGAALVMVAVGLWYFFGRPGEILQPQWATVELAGATMTRRTLGVWTKVQLADGRSVEIPGVRLLPSVTRVCVRGAMPRGTVNLALRFLPDSDCAAMP
jgi:hypothetical protein